MTELNLYKANQQWARRPPDERFTTIEEMHNFCAESKALSVKKYMTPVQMNLHSNQETNEILIDADEVGEVKFSTWGFNQLSYLAEAPPSFLRKLPAELAVECIKYGLDKNADNDMQVLIHNGENKLCRSILTPSYKRIYNADVTKRLLGLQEYGWKVPPARPAFPFQPGTRKATLNDVLSMESYGGMPVKVGDDIAPGGLFASDHDMFVFMIDPDKYVEDGSGKPLYRGFFASNSEVGASTFTIQTFLFRSVCGNLIVWGASNVKIVKIKHIGKAELLFKNEFQSKLLEYTNSSLLPEQQLINAAREKLLGKDQEEVVETILAHKIKLGKKFLERAYEEVELSPEDGSPNSLWGIIQGITRLSQESNYTDDKLTIDLEAGKLMQLV